MSTLDLVKVTVTLSRELIERIDSVLDGRPRSRWIEARLRDALEMAKPVRVEPSEGDQR